VLNETLSVFKEKISIILTRCKKSEGYFDLTTNQQKKNSKCQKKREKKEINKNIPRLRNTKTTTMQQI